METDHVVEEQPEFWEPRTFEVGDRVELIVSPECDWRGIPESHADASGWRHGDLSSRNGDRGVVRIVDNLSPHWGGHRFVVHMDSPEVNGGCCISFAAIELVKIE